jgi:hypothetical protein
MDVTVEPGAGSALSRAATTASGGGLLTWRERASIETLKLDDHDRRPADRTGRRRSRRR